MSYKKIAVANAYNEYNGTLNYYRVRELVSLKGLRRLRLKNSPALIGDVTEGRTSYRKRQHLLMKVTFF